MAHKLQCTVVRKVKIAKAQHVYIYVYTTHGDQPFVDVFVSRQKQRIVHLA